MFYAWIDQAKTWGEKRLALVHFRKPYSGYGIRQVMTYWASAKWICIKLAVTRRVASNARQVKNHWFAWRANQWSLVEEILFSSVPASNSLVSVSDPWRTFWADMVSFKGPGLTLYIASGTTEKQVCCTRRGGPRTPSRTTDSNLDRAFVENTLVFVVPKSGGARPPLGPHWLSPVQKTHIILGNRLTIFGRWHNIIIFTFVWCRWALGYL